MKKLFIAFALSACTGTNWTAPTDFHYVPIQTEYYEIATWQKISDIKNNTVHIYIEGDGNAFDSYGSPTGNPTPKSTFMRDMATKDNFANVVYMARPCQFIMDKNCGEIDWTSGRFSKKIIDAESQAINKIAKNKHIVLVGYSGGALVSGLVIKQNPKLRFDKWITIAGVLNHTAWTQYFGDEPLALSLELTSLPKVAQVHFVGDKDDIVPFDLAKTWAKEGDIQIIKSATHNNFGDLKIFD